MININMDVKIRFVIIFPAANTTPSCCLSDGGLVVLVVSDSATPWTVARQALSMGFSRQEYWGGLPFPSSGDLHHPGIEPGSPALQADYLPIEPFYSVL